MKSTHAVLAAALALTVPCADAQTEAPGLWEHSQINPGCARQDVQRSGNTMKFRFECSKPRTSSGEGEMTFLSDKAYAGKTTVTTQIKGQPQQMNIEMSGQWLSADCGDIQPSAMPAR